jgi:hypothetical protein
MIPLAMIEVGIGPNLFHADHQNLFSLRRHRASYQLLNTFSIKCTVNAVGTFEPGSESPFERDLTDGNGGP